MKDINEVLVMVKNDDYDGLCRLSRSNPYIQHWKLFEMALRKNIERMRNETLLSPPDQSFSMKLVESGYEITEEELDEMEREVGDEPLYSIRDWFDGPEDIGYFRRLKRGIIDHQLMRCKSLHELC